MNQSLIHVANHTSNLKVLEVAKFLLDNRSRRVSVTFIKADKVTPRTMVFVPDCEWNETTGRATTTRGRAMVAAKGDLNMITVQEIVSEGDGNIHLQPRTCNLATVIDYHLA